MAWRLGKAFVEFFVKDGKFRSGLSRVGASLQKIQAGMQMASKIARNMLLVMIGAGVGFVKLFATQEKAEKMLDAALEATGNSVEKYGQRLRKAASEIQKNTVYGDEFLLQLMAQGLNLGATGDNIEQYTKQAIGLATALKMDLNTAMRYTVLAMQGEMTMLQRYIPALRQTEDATEKLAIVQATANAGYRQAQAEINTTAGRIAQLKNRLGDIGERIGAALLPMLEKLIGPIEKFADKVSKLSEKTIKELIDNAKILAEVLVAIWIAPKLIMGIRAFVSGIKGAITVVGFLKGAIIALGTAASVVVLGPLAILTAGFALIIHMGEKALALHREIESSSRSIAELRQKEKELREELANADTQSDRLSILTQLQSVIKQNLDLERQYLQTIKDEDVSVRRTSKRMIENLEEKLEANKEAIKEKKEEIHWEDQLAAHKAKLAQRKREKEARQREKEGTPDLTTPSVDQTVSKKAQQVQFVGLQDMYKRLATSSEKQHDKEMLRTNKEQLRVLKSMDEKLQTSPRNSGAPLRVK